MRVSEYFSLGKTQPYLDFVDVPVDGDVPVFVTPSALRSLRSSWGHDCASLVQHYFELVIKNTKNGNHDAARELLSCLSERNEFHIGYSSGRSRGSAFGAGSAKSVWEAITKSKAVTSGLIADLEDTCLFIEGVGEDRVSDAICNIIRGPLVAYTQEICGTYGIPLTPSVTSGPIWDPATGLWAEGYVELPVASTGPVVLIPKIIVRRRLDYNCQEYYSSYILPELQKEEIQKGTSLVRFLKDGTPRVTKKALKEKYGTGKLAATKQTLIRPGVLEKYRSEKDNNPRPPLDHMGIAEASSGEAPKWKELGESLDAIPTGRKAATAYEDAVEDILSALFYPSLSKPYKQSRLHDGRKRIDIRYTNEATGGFFSWLARHYSSAFVFVECKNYEEEISNPELDQLSGRFSKSRGQFGLLVCRSVDDLEKFTQRCIDTAHDGRGYIVVLTDTDLKALLAEAEADESDRQGFAPIRKKFERLVM